eukprot:TRINITY_DN6545_c0_g1_i4.p1 TRINITY_DN6545_c0_g1~~TRINITY_DN6545_c0_g1_i4.p1  ORF type:complete len:224 (+),score=-8.34 TRINITY_DN6545_c0_g1_i4:77-748(+)
MEFALWCSSYDRRILWGGIADSRLWILSVIKDGILVIIGSGFLLMFKRDEQGYSNDVIWTKVTLFFILISILCQLLYLRRVRQVECHLDSRIKAAKAKNVGLIRQLNQIPHAFTLSYEPEREHIWSFWAVAVVCLSFVRFSWLTILKPFFFSKPSGYLHWILKHFTVFSSYMTVEAVVFMGYLLLYYFYGFLYKLFCSLPNYLRPYETITEKHFKRSYRLIKA